MDIHEQLLREILVELRRVRAMNQVALSVPSAATALDLSDKTVWKYVGERRIRPVRDTGRRVIIARTELERFANDNAALVGPRAVA